MTNQALYRIWRPQNFTDLAGQEHIRRTLENALTLNRISHAYLFTGPKGTGKTSTARIFAKALNCANRDGAQPCGICESCVSIARGSALDVTEIDAASNRGVEDARDLREKVAFLPAIGKYKVYIVDEAHMLTPEAFNTLLKTLEEPPEHVVFILATTDHSRMPVTVLSRCQRFDFRKLSSDAVKTLLEKILSEMGRSAEPEALSIITRLADGSMRDAISMLDQCLSYCLDTLTADEVSEILGVARREALAGLMSAIVAGDANTLFNEMDIMLTGGIDPIQLIREFAGYCRDLLLMAICGYRTQLVQASGVQRELMMRHCDALGSARLQGILAQADQAMGSGRYRGVSSYMAEAFFAGLLLEISRNSSQATGATLSPVTGVAKVASPATGATRTAPPATSMTNATIAAPPATGASNAVSPATSATGVTQTAPPAAGTTNAAIAAPPATGVTKAAPSEGRTASPAPDTTKAASPATGAMKAAPLEGRITPDAPFATASPPAAAQTDGISAAQWSKILTLIKSRKVTLHAFLSGAEKQELDNGLLRLYFDREKGGFHKDRCEETVNLSIIKEAVTEIIGAEVKVECGFTDEIPAEKISEERIHAERIPVMDPVDKAIAIFGKDKVKII